MFDYEGGDDGAVKVWDLRGFGPSSEPVANFQHHKGAVTGLEWHQEDSTVFASSGADDQVFILVNFILCVFFLKQIKTTFDERVQCTL